LKNNELISLAPNALVPGSINVLLEIKINSSSISSINLKQKIREPLN